MKRDREQYVSDARDRGALHTVGGMSFVCDQVVDPIVGDVVSFVSHCEGPLLDTEDGRVLLEEWLRQSVSGRVLLRTDANVRMSLPWHIATRYVGLDTAAAPYIGRAPSPWVLRSADRADDLYIARCLTIACERGYAGLPISQETLRSFVTPIIDDPQRVSFVAELDDRTIGHLTARPFDADDLTAKLHGARTELVDVLAELDVATGAVIDDLVGVAISTMPLPILATVVHQNPEQADKILSNLVGKGWSLRFVDWTIGRHDTPGAEGARPELSLHE